MITFKEAGKPDTKLEWVYLESSPEFRRCRLWLVVFSEDSHNLYGLGFDPYDLSEECEKDPELENWHWPTNERFHNALAVLTKDTPGCYDWEILEKKS